MDIPGTLEDLDLRVRTLLPEQYHDCYESVKPVSMGSAGLKYGKDGKVAWDEMWGSFCDLAMAGGPPHKGTLLEPASAAEIEADPEGYAKAASEICRGVELVAYMPAIPAAAPGWVEVDCEDPGMAGWLVRAIVMENVSAFCEGTVLHLPAGPAYRIEKEIKNVITSIAKTSHYWLDHTWTAQRNEIAALFSRMPPLLEPATVESGQRNAIAAKVTGSTRLRLSSHTYPGWCGFDCPDVGDAIWMMRALVASNVLARREGTTLFVPLSAAGDRLAQVVVDVYKLAAKRPANPS